MSGRVELDVANERRRQDAKWGQQEHAPFVWLTILMEEAGEASREALHAQWAAMGKDTMAYDHHVERLRKELIEVAAVAQAAVECIDRGQWDWGKPTLKGP